MLQFASGMLYGRLGLHNPPALERDPLRSRSRRLCTPCPPLQRRFLTYSLSGVYRLKRDRLVR